MPNIAANQPIITPAVSNLLLSTNFASTTAMGSFATAFVFTGTDSETGFVWPDNDSDQEGPMKIYYGNLLHAYNSPPETITSGNFSTYYGAEIQTVTGPDATSEKALYIEVKSQNAAHASQIDLQFQRIITGTNTAATGDLEHLYTSYYFKRPASVLAAMSVGNSLAQLDFKTGGYDNLFGGDFRIIQELYKGSDNLLHIRTRGDRLANGTMTQDPNGILPFSATSTDSYFSKYWQETNRSVVVPVDEWVKLETYIYRHQKNGIVLSAINDQIVCAHVGRTMGEFGNYWGRLFPALCYGNVAPNPQWVCRLRFHDYPPDGSVLQIPAANLLYKHAA